MATMTARYNGTCYVCHKHIAAGTQIDYDRGAGGARHLTCTPYVPPPGAIYISAGEGYGGQMVYPGDVVRNPYYTPPGKTERRFPDGDARRAWEEPTHLFVLRGDKQYVREDGLSFGVGDDSGYIYSAYCRPATAEEAAPLIARQQREEQHRAATARVEQIRRQIHEQGERPSENVARPQGIPLFVTNNIYGGGGQFVVQPDAVWHVEQNGMDGDDWGASNVTSSTAIAWTLADPDGTLGAELRQLAAIMDRSPS